MKPRVWSLIAMLTVCLILFACGGIGMSGGGSRLSVTDLVAKVVLPSGATGSVTELKVWTSAGEESPMANGDVGVKVYNNGPQYTEVRNAAGKLVASGFIGGSRTQLNMTSTAEALVYFAIGGPLQRGSANSQAMVLAAAKNFTGFANVVSAVTGSFNANGYVSPEDPSVVSALEALRNSLFSSSASKTRGPEITPTKEASGLELQDNVNDQVTIRNTFFRRGYLWLERTGYKDTSGASHVALADISDKAIAMPIRYGGTVDSATGLIVGQYDWEPATMEPLATTADLPSVSNEEEVYYKLTTVGIGTLPGDFLELTGDQINRWEELVYNTTYLDFFLPIFANLVLPLDGASLDDLVAFNESHQTVRDWVTAARAGMPQISSLAAQGKFPEAVHSFVTSSQLPNIVEMAASVTTEWGETRGSSLFKGQQDLLNRIKQASNNVGMIRLADVVAEMAPLADIAESHQADIFTIVSRKSSVSLKPVSNEIKISDTTDIDCTIKNPQAGVTYRFEWTVNNPDFFVQDVDGNSTDESPGGVLKSPHKKVFIGNLTTKEGTPVVTCKVYNGQTLIGTATTSVTFKENIDEIIGRIIYKSRYKQISSTGWNWSYACIAEIDMVPNAASYKMTVTDAAGKNVKVKTWVAETPPTFFDTLMYAAKPANVFWVEIESGSGAGHGFTGSDGGEQQVKDLLAEKIAGYQTKYNGAVCRVVVTMK